MSNSQQADIAMPANVQINNNELNSTLSDQREQPRSPNLHKNEETTHSEQPSCVLPVVSHVPDRIEAKTPGAIIEKVNPAIVTQVN